MERAELVLAVDFCTHHHISYTFIEGLREAGLLEIIMVDEQQFLQASQLHDLEKWVRFHTELDINPEGVETIVHLLHKIDELQQELRMTKQRITWYERHL